MSLKDDFDDQVGRMKQGLDAAEQWSEVAWRIADALEHQVVMQSVGFAAMMGRMIDLDKLGHELKHRTRCPGCLAMRHSSPAPLVKAPLRS